MHPSEPYLPENIQHTDLPVPDSVALEHCQRVCARINQEISESQEIISFARFMELALYEPGLGYYVAGARKFGEEGDFITAPELSSLYSRCVARQCQQILDELNNGSILELGPGTGVMACDIMQELEHLDCLPEKYLMLEISAELKDRQQKLIKEKIPHLEGRIRWLDSLPENEFVGLILANEVLDAMPVHRISVKQDSVDELCVGIDHDQFIWVQRPANDGLLDQTEIILKSLKSDLPEVYISEINCRIQAWLNSLVDILDRGAILFMDYGYPRHEYYHPQRTEGTLLCHYRHRVHANPFFFPGLQDITASVDFTTVAEAASNAGLDVGGYTTQAHFLLGCGLDAFIGENKSTDNKKSVELSRQARILTMPGEMGERFKVMALTKDLDIPLMGFQFIDHRSRL